MIIGATLSTKWEQEGDGVRPGRRQACGNSHYLLLTVLQTLSLILPWMVQLVLFFKPPCI